MRVILLDLWAQLARLGVVFERNVKLPYHRNGSDWYDRGYLVHDGVRQAVVRERTEPPPPRSVTQFYATTGSATTTSAAYVTTTAYTTVTTANGITVYYNS